MENFKLLTNDIRRFLPFGYFAGIILSYLINAVLIIALFTPIFSMVTPNAIWVTIPGALVVQFFRLLIVFTDLLFKNMQGKNWMVQIVAIAMTVTGIIEIGHLVSSIEGISSAQRWSIILFADSIIVAGYLLEISFVTKINQLLNYVRKSTEDQLAKLQKELAQMAAELTNTKKDYQLLQQATAKKLKAGAVPLELSPNGQH